MATTGIAPNPQPTGITPWFASQDGKTQVFPATIFLLYMISLDAAVRSLSATILTNAANDTAAAAAGVPINGLYRNGNAVQIRLT